MPESWFELSLADQSEALGVAAARSARPAHLLEKDVWVVWALSAIYASPLGDALTFKGGTSLSRVYKVVDRLACIVRLPVHPLAKRPDGNVTDQVTDQVTEEIARLLTAAAQGEHTRNALQEALGLKHTPHFREAFLLPALEAGLIEMTLPDKPRSSKQRYRLTPQGQRWLDTHPGGAL